jgi:lipoyl(octanoyl) transferase
MIESKSMNNFEASYLGLVEYSKAVSLQEDLVQVVKNKGLTAVVGLEHPAVLTLGHRLELNAGSLPVDIPQVKSSRGGLMTIHSEGQLVIYPIVDLRDRGWGVKSYVCKLLRTTQKLLSELGVESHVDQQAIGLYTAAGKIAFCGIQVKNGVSLHGISLNVRNDLSLFQNIQACGIQNAELDRLQNYDVNLTLEELFQRWIKHFQDEVQDCQ